MANQPSSETYNLPIKSAPAPQARRIFGLSWSTRFRRESGCWSWFPSSPAYLVLPPLYSVIQTSLFTTKLTGELDEFTFRYYRDLFRELQVWARF